MAGDGGRWRDQDEKAKGKRNVLRANQLIQDLIASVWFAFFSFSLQGNDLLRVSSAFVDSQQSFHFWKLTFDDSIYNLLQRSTILSFAKPFRLQHSFKLSKASIMYQSVRAATVCHADRSRAWGHAFFGLK